MTGTPCGWGVQGAAGRRRWPRRRRQRVPCMDGCCREARQRGGDAGQGPAVRGLGCMHPQTSINLSLRALLCALTCRARTCRRAGCAALPLTRPTAAASGATTSAPTTRSWGCCGSSSPTRPSLRSRQRQRTRRGEGAGYGVGGRCGTMTEHDGMGHVHSWAVGVGMWAGGGQGGAGGGNGEFGGGMIGHSLRARGLQSTPAMAWQ